MWPFDKHPCLKTTPPIPQVAARQKEKLFNYTVTFVDNTFKKLIANEFNWNENDVVFSKEHKDGNLYAIYWVRTTFVRSIERVGYEIEYPEDTTKQL